MYTDQKSYDGKVRLMDVTSKEFLRDPYRFYRERREAGKIIQIMKESYSVMGYEIGSEVLRSRSTGKHEHFNSDDPEIRAFLQANPVVNIIRNWMLMHNPPSHTRLRQLVARAFTPSKISELEGSMREIMQERLSTIEPGQSINFISEVAYPFPVTVISHMMGIPDEDIHLFRKWSQDFAYALATDVGSLPDTVRNRLNESAVTLTKYFEKLIDKKRSKIHDGITHDLLETLLLAQEDGDRLSTAELLSNATLLLVAGHETTTNLLGNGLHALLQHPNQIEILSSDPKMIPNAVEEFLRYDAPVQSVGRLVLEDTEIAGIEFKKGEQISVAIGGANRDPDVNPEPAKLDVTRDNPQHLSFAAGIHYCLGAPLARLEAKVAFEELFNKFEHMELQDGVEHSPNWLLRGYSKLPVVFR